MTPQERQMLADLFERVKAAGSAPRDAEAERFIGDAVKETPFSPYVLSQTVLVQQQALEAAAHRIAELESAARQGAPEEHGSFLGNLGKSLFGAGPAPRPAAPTSGPGYGPPPSAQPGPGSGYAAPPPPPPGYGPPPRGPWGAPSGGGGFLQNAASTAAGVAGGVALGSLIGNLFGGHSGAGLFGGGFGSAGFPPGGETINNFYETAPDRNVDPDQVEPSMPDDAGYIDDASFDDGSSDDSSGGGYDDV